MSDLLLDTHAYYWYDKDPSQFSGRVKKALRSKAATIFVSAISLYEIAYKARKTELAGAMDLIDQMEKRIVDYDMRILPISHRHAVRAAQLDWTNRDPFDRILAAQAIDGGLILVTKDAAFSLLEDVHTMW